MKSLLFFVSIHLLFVVGIPIKSQSQHITIPIHYSKWIPNFSPHKSEHGFSGENGATLFSEIPIAFFMKDTGKVQLYEKLEIGINLPEDAKKLIANFIKTGRGMNPFDPEQITIKAIFSFEEYRKKPDHKIEHLGFIKREIHAFYYDEFHTEMNDPKFKHGFWEKDTTSFNFRIRFAPNKIGWWKCTINIHIDGKLQYFLPSFEFLCENGNSNGFITGVSENKRLLQFENGNNFFGIGQNIPIADLPNAIMPEGFGATRGQPPMGFDLQREYISELAENGGNLVRIMNGEWADAIEWEKLNDYSMNMNFAWEQDRTFDLCREKNVFLLWAMQYHAAVMHHNPYGNDALAWPASPYHKELKIENPKDFFTNKNAIKFYQYKIRYQLSRWGYSRMIAGLQIINEINEVGSDPILNIHPYFSDTSFRNKVGDWFLEMKNYIQKDLNYPFLFGSSYTADVGAHVVGDPVMSIADFNDYHPYAQDRTRNIGGRFGGINITPGYGIFKRFEKPTIIGEMGTWDTEYLQECHENEFHIDLWATTFMGGWAGGLHWHNWEDNYKMNLRKNFMGLRLFLIHINYMSDNGYDIAKIPWTPNRWPENDIKDSTYSEKKDNYFESLYMTGDKSLFNDTRAFGWVHNRSHYWYNLPETDCEKELSNKKTKQNIGKKAFRPADDDEGKFVKYEGKENESKRTIRISNLKNFKKYAIHWYDTETGDVKITTREFHLAGKFKVTIPDEINQTTYQDFGFTIRPVRRTFTGEKINRNSKF